GSPARIPPGVEVVDARVRREQVGRQVQRLGRVVLRLALSDDLYVLVRLDRGEERLVLLGARLVGTDALDDPDLTRVLVLAVVDGVPPHLLGRRDVTGG